MSDERGMTSGLFRWAFPFVSLWSSSSLTNMTEKMGGEGNDGDI